MKTLEEINISEEEIGYCIVPPKIINETKIENTNDYEIGVYIPKLMTEIDMKDSPYIEEKTNLKSSMIINSSFPIEFPKSIKLCNFVRVQPYSDSNVKPQIMGNAERCYIKFMNKDIKKPYYTRQYTNSSNRERDIYSVGAKSGDNDYQMTLDGINKNVNIKLTNDISFSINEETQCSEIKIKDNLISIKDDKINLNSINGLYINGEKIEDIIENIARRVMNDVNES